MQSAWKCRFEFMRFRLSVYLSLWLVIPIFGPLGAQVLQEKAEVAVAAEPLRFVEWESLGFSPDGRYFADLVYGVESVQAGNYFSRLRILRLIGNTGELVFGRTLRRSHLLQDRGPEHNALMIRAIAQDLLRRESRTLNRFQIEAMEMGETLWLSDSARETGTEGPDNSGRIYTAIRGSQVAVPLAVFELRNLRLDQDFGAGGVLRGRLSVSEFQGAPRSYDLESEWSFQYTRQPNIQPVFMSLSPQNQGRYLVLTLRIYQEPKAEGSVMNAASFETNDNYDFVSLALRVY